MIASRYHTWLKHGDPADLEPDLQVLLPALQAQARRVPGNASDADDAVQEACLVLLATRRRLPMQAPLAAITRRLTGQRSLMAARTRQRRWQRYLALPCLSEIGDGRCTVAG